MADVARQLLEIYDRLYRSYGPQHWWPAEAPFEVIVGAILTQSAAWTNVEKAIAGLKQAGKLSPQAVNSPAGIGINNKNRTVASIQQDGVSGLLADSEDRQEPRAQGRQVLNG